MFTVTQVGQVATFKFMFVNSVLLVRFQMSFWGPETLLGDSFRNREGEVGEGMEVLAEHGDKSDLGLVQKNILSPSLHFVVYVFT